MSNNPQYYSTSSEQFIRKLVIRKYSLLSICLVVETLEMFLPCALNVVLLLFSMQ